MSGNLTAVKFGFYLVIIILAIALTGCRSSAQTQTANGPEPAKSAKGDATAPKQEAPVRIEKPISPQSISQPQTAVSQVKQTSVESAPPTEAEVANVIARVYKDSVFLAKDSPLQFVTGDFNCDGSEDIAIVVKPVEDKLGDINSEVANWILESPKKIGAPAMTAVVRVSPARSVPEQVSRDERLLTIIHGFGAKGWRDPAARQTYLLRDVAGEQLKQISMNEFIKNVRDKDVIVKRSGDVISDSMNKETGFIFWNGSKYAWYH